VRKRYVAMISIKYNIVYIFPISSNGVSTVFVPIQVRIRTVVIISQNLVFFVVENLAEGLFFAIRIIRIMIDIARAITPPNFDGIERRIT